MDGIEQLERLAADLAAGPDVLQVGVRQVVSKGALNIKNDWRGRASGLAHAPAYPFSIGYDLTQTASLIGAEIGPDKNKRQGPLGNILEFGTSKNPPRLDGQQALAAEEPRFVAALEAALEAATLP